MILAWIWVSLWIARIPWDRFLLIGCTRLHVGWTALIAHCDDNKLLLLLLISADSPSSASNVATLCSCRLVSFTGNFRRCSGRLRISLRYLLYLKRSCDCFPSTLFLNSILALETCSSRILALYVGLPYSFDWRIRRPEDWWRAYLIFCCFWLIFLYLSGLLLHVVHLILCWASWIRRQLRLLSHLRLNSWAMLLSKHCIVRWDTIPRNEWVACT